MYRWLLLVPIGVTLVLTPGATADKSPATDAMRNVAKDNNAFAFSLYAKLRGAHGNLFFSPGSVSIALAMTYDGARGETAEQMAKTLHFSQDRPELNDGFGALLQQLNGTEGKKRAYELRIANALWSQQGEKFLPAFLDTTRKHYGAGLRLVDFAANAEQARQTINRWVEKQTKDKIRDLMPEGTIDSSTRLVLTNAVYFNGTWQDQFKKSATHNSLFHISANTTASVPTMHQSSHFRYLNDEDVQVLELPYQGNDLSMIVLLPRRMDGLSALESRLSAEQVDKWLSQARSAEVELSMPRFKMTQEFSLGKTLADMGMPLAFGPSADFSGMDGRTDLHIGVVMHKAFVDVNEEGTEAAAATGVGIRLAAVLVKERFNADHPFVFLIRDNRAGSVLFLGRVIDPRK